MPAGRPRKNPPSETTNITEAAIAKLSQEMGLDTIEAARLAGQVQACHAIKQLITVAELTKLQQIREHKLYLALRGQKATDANGEYLLGTWDSFCRWLGRSETAINEDLLNLATIGAPAMETVRQFGLGYRELRQLRKLDETDRQVVVGEIEANAGDKDAILALIDDLSAKHAKEKDKLTKQLESTKKDLINARQVSLERTTEANQVKEQLKKWESGTQDWPEWERVLQNEILLQSGKAFEAIDGLHSLRDRLVNLPLERDQQADDDRLLQPPAAIYLRAVEVLFEQANELMLMAREVFEGYQPLGLLPTDQSSPN